MISRLSMTIITNNDSPMNFRRMGRTSLFAYYIKKRIASDVTSSCILNRTTRRESGATFICERIFSVVVCHHMRSIAVIYAMGKGFRYEVLLSNKGSCIGGYDDSVSVGAVHRVRSCVMVVTSFVFTRALCF